MKIFRQSHDVYDLENPNQQPAICTNWCPKFGGCWNFYVCRILLLVTFELPYSRPLSVFEHGIGFLKLLRRTVCRPSQRQEGHTMIVGLSDNIGGLSIEFIAILI